MAQLPRKVEINLAAIPVSGFGGLCMVVTSLVCAAALPQTRWFMLAAIAAGAVFGFAKILARRRSESDPPADDAWRLLGVEGTARRQSRRALTTPRRMRIALS